MNKSTFSKIIAGTMTWGIWGKNLSRSEMIDRMELCIENEITTFDHADIYGAYTTEAAFGIAFKESAIPRENIEFISKCGIQYLAETRNNKIKHYNYSAAYIVESAELSLRNLQTDYLDLLLLHRPSPLMHPDAIASAVLKLKETGKIRDFGVSNFTPSQTDLIQTKTKVNYNQIQFSATHLEAMLDGTLDHMQLHSITPMAWSPLGSAIKGEDEKSIRVRNLIQTLAKQYNCSTDLILLAWILKHPSGILPVCGTTDTNRLSKLKLAHSISLDLEDWFSIWVESSGSKVP